MFTLKEWLKRTLPPAILHWYYQAIALLAAWYYNYPSAQLIIIGVTGTKGKSTACNLIWHLLTAAGYKVGLATTANFRIGDQHWLNKTKMTMLGRTQLQQLLKQMVQAGCTHAIIETSSEGIKQWRHSGINYDVVAFTNLYPEHIDSHGSFENYKQAKLELFRYLARCTMKKIDPSLTLPFQGRELSKKNFLLKGIVINGDSEYANEFLQATPNIPERIIWSQQQDNPPVNLLISAVSEQPHGLTFTIGDYRFTSQLLGKWNIENIASAIGIGVYCGLSLPAMAVALTSFTSVPGRMELIDEGQSFTLVVDYAYEPKSLRLLYEFWRRKIGKDHKIITLISSTGGGRDISRRSGNGKVAGELCDYVIVADEDPYDDDPQTIINQVAEGVMTAGKIEHENCWKISNRYEAIKKACALAQPGDVVILPCKGADQKMCLAKGKKIDWDDREIARTILRQYWKP